VGLTAAGQLERWAQNLTPARLKWRVKRDNPTGWARFAIPTFFSFIYQRGVI